MDHYEKDGIAEKYNSFFGRNKKGPGDISKAIRRFNNFTKYIPSGGNILDSGCGTGRFISYFLERSYTVSGIDTSEAMLSIARRENPGADFRLMDMRKLQFPADHFDGIWNVASLLHLDKKGVKSAMDEANRVLRLRGILYIATRTGSEDNVVVEEATEGGKMTVHYYRLITLQEILVKSGFSVVDSVVEPDDLGRPFDYCYIYAASKKDQP